MGFIWGFYDGLDQQLYLQKIASKSRDACQGLEMSLKSRDWTCKSTVETSRRVLKTGDGRLFFFKTSHATQHFYFSCWHTTQTQIHLCARKSFIHLVCSSGGWVYPQCLPKLVVNKRVKTGSKDRILLRAQTHTHARRRKHGLTCTDSIKEDACIISVCVCGCSQSLSLPHAISHVNSFRRLPASDCSRLTCCWRELPTTCFYCAFRLPYPLYHEMPVWWRCWCCSHWAKNSSILLSH